MFFCSIRWQRYSTYKLKWEVKDGNFSIVCHAHFKCFEKKIALVPVYCIVCFLFFISRFTSNCRGEIWKPFCNTLDSEDKETIKTKQRSCKENCLLLKCLLILSYGLLWLIIPSLAILNSDVATSLNFSHFFPSHYLTFIFSFFQFFVCLLQSNVNAISKVLLCSPQEKE